MNETIITYFWHPSCLLSDLKDYSLKMLAGRVRLGLMNMRAERKLHKLLFTAPRDGAWRLASSNSVRQSLSRYLCVCDWANNVSLSHWLRQSPVLLGTFFLC